VTAFGKLIRTTAFRLTLVYLFLFALFAASLLGFFAWNTRWLINEQITTTVNAETGEISDIFARRGLRGLVLTIENRALRPGANLYLVTTPAGQAIAGNVGSLAPGVMAAQWSVLIVVVLGLGGGIFVARRVLRRIDAMTGTTQRIMAGDLSGRLPVGRSGDELDRLAGNLNAMLERIEALMMGLKEVSDNIAHDLKTPLTRLRNRAEEALAKSRTEGEYRSALERTIEESDGLIRTFNALLMIARAESGQARGDMDDFDAADVAHGIHELYEPLAEDDGTTLSVKAESAPIHGNRELISQALANLVENAIKYGKPDAAAQPLSAGTVSEAGRRDILIEARREGDLVLLSVTDHGPGIPLADRKHAVERFVRLEASRTLPGSGLGLSLASAVATLHGGDLRLDDAQPGLVATLAIPALAGGSDRLAAQTQDVPQKAA
jgi:signal transduction histidine kinase